MQVAIRATLHYVEGSCWTNNLLKNWSRTSTADLFTSFCYFNFYVLFRPQAGAYYFGQHPLSAVLILLNIEYYIHKLENQCSLLKKMCRISEYYCIWLSAFLTLVSSNCTTEMRSIWSLAKNWKVEAGEWKC